MKTKVVFLIGPPAVGKSHWLEHEAYKHGITNPLVISRDNLVDIVANLIGKTYDDMFSRDGKTPEIDEANKTIDGLLQSRFDLAKEYDCIVIDMTNMSVKSRMRNWNRLGLKNSDIEKIAILFDWTSIEDLISIADKRAQELKLKGQSKTIPESVYKKMLRDFQPPSPEEQYTQTITVEPWWK